MGLYFDEIRSDHTLTSKWIKTTFFWLCLNASFKLWSWFVLRAVNTLYCYTFLAFLIFNISRRFFLLQITHSLCSCSHQVKWKRSTVFPFVELMFKLKIIFLLKFHWCCETNLAFQWSVRWVLYHIDMQLYILKRNDTKSYRYT